MSVPWTAFVVLILLVVAALASVAEAAITRMSRVRALHLEQEKRKGATPLVRITEDPGPHTNVVLLVMLTAQVTATVLVALAVARRLDTAVPVAVVVMTLLIFVLSKVVPTTYAVQHTDRAALVTAPVVRVLTKVLGPLGKTMIVISNAVLMVLPGKGMPKGPYVTEDEIRHMIDVAEEEEEIEEEERELIHSIFEFGDTVVREVMVPRPDMVTVPSTATLDEALEVILEAGYSRIPVYEGDNDNIVGLLYAKDVMRRLQKDAGREARVTELSRSPAFVPEQKRVRELLREMQEERVHMAIVVDEYGGTAGLVTIEDLIEEIVGEIVDEYDQEEPLVEPLGDSVFRVDAKMPIDEVNELLQVELPEDEWDTVGGLVFGLTGRVPVAGETVALNGCNFRTERVTGRRIQKVVIEKLEPSEEGDDD